MFTESGLPCRPTVRLASPLSAYKCDAPYNHPTNPLSSPAKRPDPDAGTMVTTGFHSPALDLELYGSEYVLMELQPALYISKYLVSHSHKWRCKPHKHWVVSRSTKPEVAGSTPAFRAK